MLKSTLYILSLIVIVQITSLKVFSKTQFFPIETINNNHHSSLLRGPALDALYISSFNDNKHYMAYNFGTKIPVLSYDTGNMENQTGGYGGIFTRFELFTYDFDFIHSDFLGGLFHDTKYKNFIFEIMFYHVSSHIGDDYVNDNQTFIENYGFEAIKHYTNYRLINIMDICIGFEYKFSRRPKRIILYDRSLFIGNKFDLFSKGIPLFLEWELEIGNNKTANIGIEAGIYLSHFFNNLFGLKNTEKELHELSFYYYYGYSKMGYFYDKKESLFLAGPTYHF